MMAILVGCIIYQLFRILSYAPLFKVQVLKSTISEEKKTYIGIMVAINSSFLKIYTN